MGEIEILNGKTFINLHGIKRKVENTILKLMQEIAVEALKIEAYLQR